MPLATKGHRAFWRGLAVGLVGLAGLAVGMLLLLHVVAPPAQARPEVMRPGIPFYSDEAIEQGPVWDIGPEKNYEEVYNNYTYFEVVYDKDGRVKRFTEYKQGDIARQEEYTYGADGRLKEKKVRGASGEWRVTRY